MCYRQTDKQTDSGGYRVAPQQKICLYSVTCGHYIRTVLENDELQAVSHTRDIYMAMFGLDFIFTIIKRFIMINPIKFIVKKIEIAEKIGN